MKKTVVINVVGLSSRLIGEHTPFLEKWSKDATLKPIQPTLPAVTCSAQSTYLTGKWPSEHGIVANGWYFKDEHEIKFWRQSNTLVQADKLWDELKRQDSSFTCANLFWWYNMYSNANYTVTPRPNYLADGRKLPDIYSQPTDLRDKLQQKLGTFPLFDFWGPKTSIKSSQWIADSAFITDQLYNPTLTLIYLPHLDYNLQRHGLDMSIIKKDLQEIDKVVEQVVEYYEQQNAQVVILSEYGITDVSRPVHLNRVLREHGLLSVREERGLELLDAGISIAFAVADHQLAHIYVNSPDHIETVKSLLESVPGVEQVLQGDAIKDAHLDHERSGDLIAVADKDSWFTYYFWLDDAKAPDYARMVDIHKKPGYDPVEMHLNPDIKMLTLKILWKLLKKKAGFRTVMDVIPLDATLIKGSHGRIPEDQQDFPVFICKSPLLTQHARLIATDVYPNLKNLITKPKD
ncbi:MAG TPA: alkaline phosphatase family protein [Pseudomonadales bacterium]